MATVLSASAVPNNELKALADLRSALPDESALGRALGELTEGLNHGVEVTLVREDDRITPTQAAGILGISRTHLYKILDAGMIPFTRVGERDRRILMSDLQLFMGQSTAFRAADARSIATRQRLENELFDSM